MRPFHALAQVPVQSNILVATRAAAVAHPTGTLELSLCGTCGFIANTAFDAALVEYSDLYEETQAFSPRFSAFLDELVHTLACRHSLAGKRVLEVGSGGGDFLRALCAAGGCTGVGYDPAHSPRPADEGGPVTFVREFYGPEDAGTAFDLVCCRHTLEHIADVRGLLALLRGPLQWPDAALFIEVPDTGRILRERAFWDVYYEHCSYFTLGSLGRLLRAMGFAIDHAGLAYEDQYVLVDSRRGSGGLEAPDDVAETRAAAAGFGRDVAAALDGWRADIAALRADGRRVVLWGAGSKAVGFLTGLGREVAGHVTHVVDINPGKQGTYLPGTGQPIVAPEALLLNRPDVVVVMNPVYTEEIGAALHALGLHPELRPL